MGSAWRDDEVWEGHVASARFSFRLLRDIQVSGEGELENPADVGATCVPEKEMAAALKLLGMRHSLRMTSLRCLKHSDLDENE